MSDASGGRRRRTLTLAYVVDTITVLPAALFLLVRDPVKILSIAGIVAAAHTSVVAGLTLYMNRRFLPGPLRTGPVSTVLLGSAALLFTLLAVLYFLQLAGIRPLE